MRRLLGKLACELYLHNWRVKRVDWDKLVTRECRRCGVTQLGVTW